MDLLLIFYSILLGLIFVSPFFFYRLNVKDPHNPQSFLLEKKNMLLENLKDLQHEFQTGKTSLKEFEEISESVILDLKFLDEQLSNAGFNFLAKSESHDNLEIFCNSCKTKIQLNNANFCSNCVSANLSHYTRD